MCKTDDSAAISRLLGDYIAACHAGNASAVALMYTDNGVLMPSDGSIFIGTDAIRSWFDAFFQQFKEELIAPIDEIEVVGDWAFTRGSWKARLTPKAGGEPTEPGGRWLVIYKRQGDGCWKFARGMLTTDRSFPVHPA